jgi:hypothetical protein
MKNAGNGTVTGLLTLLVGVILGYVIANAFKKPFEGFADATSASCNSCGKPLSSCGCPVNVQRPVCAPCKEPDMSKYVLRSSVPPCPPMPDLSKYMLKTECPPVPDLSNYVLKSSIPRQGPIVLDCSKCAKSKGECPPCPRPRCPEVKCPEPTLCPPCAPCQRQECPKPEVRCMAKEQASSGVRPYLAPLDVAGFGS